MQIVFEPRHDKTNNVVVRPAKTQISLGIRPVWSESSLSAWRNIGSLSTHWAHSEDSDQTGRMPRVFAGRTATLLVLSCRGSFLKNSIADMCRIWLFLTYKVDALLDFLMDITMVTKEMKAALHIVDVSRFIIYKIDSTPLFCVSTAIENTWFTHNMYSAVGLVSAPRDLSWISKCCLDQT